MRKYITRRESLKRIGVISAAAATGIGLSDLLGCTGPEVRTGEENTQNFLQDYKNKTKDWDRIFGPPILRGMYGYNDFKGHVSYGSYGGVDYDVEVGTPLVPSTSSLLFMIDSEINGGLVVFLRNSVNRGYITRYSHLYKSPRV